MGNICFILFSLHINDLPELMKDPELHMPNVQEREVNDRSSFHPMGLPGIEPPECLTILTRILKYICLKIRS